MERQFIAPPSEYIGNYYFITKSEFPYALGQEGVKNVREKIPSNRGSMNFQ